MRAESFRAALAWTLLAAAIFAQGTRADYERAAQLPELTQDLVTRFQPAIRWLPDREGVYWKNLHKGGYTRVLVESGAREETMLIKDWGLDLAPGIVPPLSEWKASVDRGGQVSLKFENTFPHVVRLFWIDREANARPYGEIPPGGHKIVNTYSGHSWTVDRGPNLLVGLYIAETTSGRCIINDNSARLARQAFGQRESLKPRARVWISEYRVAMRAGKSRAEWLSRDGKESDRYLDEFLFSPDGNCVLTYQQTEVRHRTLRVPRPSEKDELKTVWEETPYAIPGDPVGWRRPRIFNLAEKRQVSIDDSTFVGAYRIDLAHWSPQSDLAYVTVIDRGHQRIRVLAIDANSGKIETLLEERSDTFIDSWNKRTLHWLESREQFIWASERDGYNHLYLYDARSGEMIQQLTQGPYVVRALDYVDEDREELWFTAYGIHPGQNPTYAHLARVDWSGSDPLLLTEANGTHHWQFNEDRTLFLDRWSRVDQPTVTELRRARDGSLVTELGRDHFSKSFKGTFHPAEVFSAPGRDGSTPIFGVLIRPSNFDPTRKYPVIEKIYAGPHDHHVPNEFTRSLPERKLAELGFIVVQIDGMGTNWRSKKFHDVCWQNLKDAGFPDRIAWLKAAAEEYPELDLDRVGIYGGSAGGQNAMAALLHHGDFYDAAAADCGCHDNRVDKLWWNEAWMGKLGPHYAENSNVTHAKNLRGDLLLTVGLSDRNVDPSCTMLVVDALIDAGKDFEFIAVPGGGHGIGDKPYLFRRRQDFFVRSLLGVEPRR